MTQNFDPARNRAATASPDVQAIEAGWTVYDSRGRPVGNVADLSGGLLRIDGRPEGFDFFEVPVDLVRNAGEGEVHLSLDDEQLTRRAATVESSAPTKDDQATKAASALQADSAVGEAPAMITPIPTSEPSAATAAPRARPAEDLHGYSYTASGAPVGQGSNTPVGNEPGGYRAWDAEVEGSSWMKYAAWLAPVGIGLPSAGAYLWWRNRQARRGRLHRLTRAFAAAGGSLAPVVDAARERKAAWWLTPLATVPLAFYLRSAGGRAALDRAVETTGSLKPDDSWMSRLPSVAVSTPDFGPLPPRWTAAVPIVGAGLAAVWFGTRARRRSRRASRQIADIMTRDVQVIRPEASIFEAASLMKRLGVGSLPVCDGRRLQGMLTDRDIVLRTVAESRDPQLAAARDAMTGQIVYAYDDDSIDRVAELMREHQIRRLPIVDRQKNLIGIVSLGDLAVDAGRDRLSGSTLERISEPSRPRR
jgi:CBS domain-containing protein